MRVLAVAAALLTPSAALLAQDAGQSGSASAGQSLLPGDLTSAAKDAAQALASAAQDKLLVKDMFGAQVTGPGGGVIGTVENLVAIPGGRIVAALITTNDQRMGRVAVPFSVVKISRTADKLGLSLPVSLSDLTSMDQVQALTNAVIGGSASGQK